MSFDSCNKVLVMIESSTGQTLGEGELDSARIQRAQVFRWFKEKENERASV